MTGSISKVNYALSGEGGIRSYKTIVTSERMSILSHHGKFRVSRVPFELHNGHIKIRNVFN